MTSMIEMNMETAEMMPRLVSCSSLRGSVSRMERIMMTSEKTSEQVPWFESVLRISEPVSVCNPMMKTLLRMRARAVSS